VADRLLHLLNAAMAAAAPPLGGQLGDEALDQVQPGAVGRGEVQVRPRMGHRHRWMAGGLWVEEVSQLTCNANSAGTARSTWAKNRLDSTARWRAVSWEMTLSEARSTAAYRLVVPWRVASWVCRWGTPGSRGRIGCR
jgi:hypothetical protein